MRYSWYQRLSSKMVTVQMLLTQLKLHRLIRWSLLTAFGPKDFWLQYPIIPSTQPWIDLVPNQNHSMGPVMG